MSDIVAVRCVIEAMPEMQALTQGHRDLVVAAFEGFIEGLTQALERLGELLQSSTDGTVQVSDILGALQG